MAEERVRTGIKGFDELIGGGFIPNTNILVSGGPGTGKTILALQAAHNLAKRGEVVYYLSFEQNSGEILYQADSLGWDLQPLMNSKKFVFRNIPVSSVDVNLSSLISKDMKQYKPSFVVIDSVTKLSSLADSLKIALDPTEYEKMLSDKLETSLIKNVPAKHLKKFIYLLLERFKKYGTTNLVITDAPVSDGISLDGASEFASDAVIMLYNLKIGQRKARTLEIMKMRGSQASNTIPSFDIVKGKGIVIKKEEPVYK